MQSSITQYTAAGSKQVKRIIPSLHQNCLLAVSNSGGLGDYLTLVVPRTSSEAADFGKNLVSNPDFINASTAFKRKVLTNDLPCVDAVVASTKVDSNNLMINVLYSNAAHELHRAIATLHSSSGMSIGVVDTLVATYS